MKNEELPVNCRECGETMGYMNSFREIAPKKSRIICLNCHNEKLIKTGLNFN